ncbi:Transposase [Limihaloglobus sulfuriphilus]|uniref:Transposase n=1 Tax=Limihaloglobus sulfuriphilus TaxID=1851148 RepID=A0A1Q2ME10_9BACT|nr:IS66 family transposase [Limihaloglobus sulfuriphilus]AQQ70941.1 Transposase [Limihaloglobus sulfuriphilus]
MAKETKITAETSKEELPSNVETLKSMVLTLLEQIDDLTGQLHYLKRQLFGKKSEKLDPAQRLLFEDMYEEVKAKVEQQREEKAEPVKKTGRKKKHNGRNPLPADLPRETIKIEPSEEEKICPVCNTPKEVIGSETTEVLEYVPALFYVKEYVRKKFCCKACESEISIGPLPPRAIDKGIAGEGLLAHIITSKYCDHAPLNRLESILKRHGVDINVSTMCGWVDKCADLLEPLVKRMHRKILESPKINTDDTRIPIKSRKRKGSTYNGYLWTYIDDKSNVVFDFTPTRSRQGPLEFLGDYAGKVQADAYSGYDEFFNKGKATEIGCNAHARRKFEYAIDDDPLRGTRMTVLWGRLYAIESRAKREEYSDEQLLEARQKEAVPILEEIKSLLDEYNAQVLPKTPTGKAVTYALNQWDALCRYTEDPILDIDNNLAERTLRMVVIGRKNYMFAGSEAGAWRASIIYSLVASCKLMGHDPFAYFNDVLRRVSTHPGHKIDELLPSNWKKPESNTEEGKIVKEQILKAS